MNQENTKGKIYEKGRQNSRLRDFIDEEIDEWYTYQSLMAPMRDGKPSNQPQPPGNAPNVARKTPHIG